MPAQAGHLAETTGEARTNRGMVGYPTAEAIADEGFDCVGFVEAHRLSRAIENIVSSMRDFTLFT